MGMYIESLHVENVGPFKRLDASFNPQMNVIIGVNGAPVICAPIKRKVAI